MARYNYSKNEIMTIIGCLLIELSMNDKKKKSTEFLETLQDWYLRLIGTDKEWFIDNCTDDLNSIKRYLDSIEGYEVHLDKITSFRFWGEHSKLGATLEVIQYLETMCEKFPQFRLNVGMGILRTKQLVEKKNKEG